jgi:hypothetical protein
MRKLAEPWKGIMVGAELGGPDVGGWVRSDRVLLNHLFDKYCAEPYNSEVTSIALFLRVEGRITSYGFEGLDSVERLKRYQAVGVDISVQRKDWNVRPAAFKKFLWHWVHEGIWACVARMKKDKLAVDEDRLRKDLAKVERAFFRKK